MSAETSVKKEYKALLTPWKIGNCEIKNRFVVTSMGGTDLFGWMERNHFDKDGARFILEAAKGGAGLVLPGCQPVYNPMFGQWLHKNKKMYRDLAKWMPEFHKTGAKLFVQLTAGFGRSFTITEFMEELYAKTLVRQSSIKSHDGGGNTGVRAVFCRVRKASERRGSGRRGDQRCA